MTKMIMAAMALLLTTSAFADDFICTMKVGQFLTETEYAPYRGREVNIVMGEYSCNGVIDNNIIVTTTLVSNTNGDTKSVSDRASSKVTMTTLDIWGDGQERLECECGLN
ncbi:MAG: hypothetical protein CME71_07750 [Halobacteriovorax sp.]|nr:hypothetical protein [Halobacteriovorax sp.]